jgi:single-stranded-DNA-specific exonuclease
MEWILPEQESQDLLDFIYKSRNIDPKDIKFFSPNEKDLYSPLLLNDVDKVATVLKDFMGTKRKIFIHGDFDVDGITATSIMWQFLYKDLGLNALPYIPSRFTEGYGLSEDSINNILNQGAELIITVDCGVKDIEIMNKYASQVQFIITDHHTILDKDTKLPNTRIIDDYAVSKLAKAVCHPKLGNYPFKELCGAAVSWKVCAAVNEILKLGIDVNKYLDLAAIGTVCDVMPLVDENRTILKLGLDKLRKTNNTGLKKLFEHLKVNSLDIDSYHLGFVVGPRINATGRLEDAMEGVRLLTTDNLVFAQKLAVKLDNLNTERQLLTQKFLEIAEEQISKQKEDRLYIVYGEDWPEGIIGLIAGKLTEKFNRPVIAGSLKDNRIKASARSIEEFHIANILSEHSTLLISHGGHAQAAGLSFDISNLSEFNKSIKRRANELITDLNLVKKLRIEAIAQISDVNSNVYNKIQAIAPFGMGNKKPLLAFLRVTPLKVNIFGKDKTHLKLFFQQDELRTEAISFGNTEFVDYIDFDKPIDVAGTIEKSIWNGEETYYLKISSIRQSP